MRLHDAADIRNVTTSSSRRVCAPRRGSLTENGKVARRFVPLTRAEGGAIGDQTLKKVEGIEDPIGVHYRVLGSGSASQRVCIYIIPPPNTSRAVSDPRYQRGIRHFLDIPRLHLDFVPFFVYLRSRSQRIGTPPRCLVEGSPLQITSDCYYGELRLPISCMLRQCYVPSRV